jgi:hypothetical protein
MMHQIKRFIVVAAVASMVPAVAFASTARMTGLNVPGDYVKDYTGMFTYLSSVNSTGNLVYAETGSMAGWTSIEDRAMGAVLPNLFDGKAGVWAIHMRQYHPALGQSWWGAPINGGFYSFDPNDNTSSAESFDLMWGHKMGSANLGLRLNRQFESYDDGTDVEEGNGNDGRNIMGFGAGVGFDMNENTSIEVGAQYQSRTFDEGDAVGDLNEDGGAAMLVAARAWMKMGANTVIVPVVKLWSIDQSSTDGTTTFDDKLSGYQAGLAGNWNVGRDDLFVLGAQLVSNKEDLGTDEYTETLMPNVFMALETHLNPWLSFRAGAQQSVFATYKYETTGLTQTFKGSDFSFIMGTTVKMGNVQFDAVLDPAFFNNPFAQLTGNTNAVFDGFGYYGGGARAAGGPTQGTVFPQVSLTYTW